MHQDKTESLTHNREGLPFDSTRGRGHSAIDNIRTAVADKLRTAANSFKQKSNQTSESSGRLSGYGNQASAWLNNSADYVRNVDISQVKTNIQEQVRRNPGRSLVIAGAAGLILGVFLRRR